MGKKFNPTKLLVVDTETTGLRPWHGHMPFAFPMCDQDGNLWYREWKVDPYTRLPEIDKYDLEQMQEWLGNPNLTKIFFNRKFDERMLNTIGIALEGKIHDVFIM